MIRTIVKYIILIFIFSIPMSAQWTEIQSPFNSSISIIHFFDENNGVVLTGDNNLYITKTGGSNWTNSNLNIPSSNIFFIDSLNWWSINDEGLYQTQNAGTSWTKNNLSNSYQYSFNSKIYFINKNIGLISTLKDILRTSDGGITWTTVFTSDSSQNINTLSFCDSTVGIAANSQYIFESTDAGKKWNAIRPPANFTIFTVQCLTKNKLAAIMWNQQLSKYQILNSSDEGNTWESKFTVNHPPNEMVFVNENIGFVVGNLIYKTTDSGNSWFTQTDPSNSHNDFRNIDVLNENYVWMSNYWNLVKTENGGGERFHFFNIDYPNTGDTINALTEIKIKWSNFSSQRDLNIKFSSDNGQTWIILASKFNSENNFYWTVPNTPSNRCKLLIENNEDISESEETGIFTIAPPPPLILTNPARNSGSLPAGYYINISWLAFNVDKIKIEFSPDSGVTWQPVVESYPADSLKYMWRLPFVSSNDCLIKITDIDNPSIYALTNIYFIIHLPSLSIIYPDENSIFNTGDTELLQIRGDYAGAMKLELTTDNGRNWLFIDSLNSSDWGNNWNRSYEWLVPDLYSDSCRLKLTIYETDSFIGVSSIFRINNNPSIKRLIASANPGDTIYLTEPDYVDCIEIDKPITLIGKGINETKITGDTIKPVIIIKADNVEIKNLSIVPKTKSDGSFLFCSDYRPTNGMDILNSFNVILDSLLIRGGEDISPGFTSGGIGLYIENSNKVNISNTKIIGANTQNQSPYSCSDKKGGDGLKILDCDSLSLFNCEVTGGKGGNGWAMGAGPYSGGDGGNSVNLNSSLKIRIINSHLTGGIGGATALSTTTYIDQAKAGDGAYCNSSNAIFLNSILEGGIAFLRPPRPDLPLNTFGGNGITAVNNSNVIIDGGKLIRGTSSEDAMGKLFYNDSTSEITFNNIIINTTVTNFECSLEKDNIKLNWNAVIGLNFMQFNIEKKTDGNNWNSIGIIKEITENNSFTFVDSNYNSTSQILNYRIKVINLDSTFSFSEEKDIIINTTVKNFACHFETNKVTLSWDAEIGLNFMEFEVERMTDNSEWNGLGIIKEIPQNNSFTFTDRSYNSTSQILKYRIKVVNLDSTFNFSEEKEISFIPTEYKLEQNYPNPFNPNTTIEYGVPEASFVKIKVFDVLGREVVTLVNEEKPVGTYRVKFNGSNLNSGIYFYRMEAGSFTQTMKLILLK